ncbi:MAG: hypothetical protein ABEN55_11245 [Bradymonadaceae bacterium]
MGAETYESQTGGGFCRIVGVGLVVVAAGVGCDGNLFRDPVAFDTSVAGDGGPIDGGPSDAGPTDSREDETDSGGDPDTVPDRDSAEGDTEGGPDGSCTPPPEQALCDKNNAECGQITVTDRCGESRVVDCGGCQDCRMCGQVSPNNCGCPCEIDGGCQHAGDKSPNNPCKVCNPNESKTAVTDGTSCGQNRTCQGGSCVCATGLTECDGTCVDTDQNTDHCGGLRPDLRPAGSLFIR